MPITKSAQKQLRKNVKARAKNTSEKENSKKLVKSLEKLVKEKKTEDAKKMLNDAYSKLDRLVKKNIMHKNTAARKKSGMMKKLQAAMK